MNNKITQFDLEQEIMHCWQVVDDIKLYTEFEDSMSEDQRMNTMIGLQQLYALKFEKLFNTFEHCVKTKQI